MADIDKDERKAGVSWRLRLVYSAVLALALLVLPPGLSRRLAAMGRLVIEPAQSFARMCSRAARGAWGGLPGCSDVDEANMLRLEAAEAKTEYERLRESTARLVEENRQLRNRIGMTLATKQMSLALCEVQQRDAFSQYYDYVVVNRGSYDGIRPGKLVISDVGLVGIVAEVGLKTAKVTLATSANFSYPCQVRSRNVSGILTGGGNDGSYPVSMLQPVPQVVVNSLDGVLFDQVAVGDLVTVTPEGSQDGPVLIAGRVADVDKSAGVAPVLHINPAASFAQLKYLFVVL